MISDYTLYVIFSQAAMSSEIQRRSNVLNSQTLHIRVERRIYNSLINWESSTAALLCVINNCNWCARQWVASFDGLISLSGNLPRIVVIFFLLRFDCGK